MSQLPQNQELCGISRNAGFQDGTQDQTASAEPMKARRDMGELCDLWNRLRDIPVSDSGEIETSFLHFDEGDDLCEVWQWFEEQNPAFIAARAGGSIGDDHPFRKGY